ncbi:hypothetical protein HPG69_014007, partial [Diceros bicornis minor]
MERSSSAQLSILRAPNMSPLASLCRVSPGREEGAGYLDSEDDSTISVEQGICSPWVLSYLRGTSWGPALYSPMDSSGSTTL